MLLKNTTVYITDKDVEALQRCLSTLIFYSAQQKNVTDINIKSDVEDLTRIVDDFKEALETLPVF